MLYDVLMLERLPIALHFRKPGEEIVFKISIRNGE